LNAVPKEIFAGYPSQFMVESFARLTRFRGIRDRLDAENLAGAKTIGGYALVTIE
jgi:hypothetical protein